jgi:hypothetical protein
MEKDRDSSCGQRLNQSSSSGRPDPRSLVRSGTLILYYRFLVILVVLVDLDVVILTITRLERILDFTEPVVGSRDCTISDAKTDQALSMCQQGVERRTVQVCTGKTQLGQG